VGINEQANNGVTLSPNPAQEVLYISSSKAFQSYTIYNLLGSQVRSDSFSNSINIKELPQGVYIITLQSKTGTVQKMWIKA
jgi:hypothetical protein